MRVLVTCVLIGGPAVLLVVGFLSVVRDLLTRGVFAAPLSPHEEHVETSQEVGLPNHTEFTSAGAPHQ
jgi:hypothetical protein